MKSFWNLFNIIGIILMLFNTTCSVASFHRGAMLEGTVCGIVSFIIFCVLAQDYINSK